MRTIAFDLSLTRTGFAVDQEVYPPTTGVLVPPKGITGTQRLAWIRDSVCSEIHSAEAELVVIEGYSYASQHQAHQLGELGGVIRLALHDDCIPLVVVQPSALKRFATGKGNAKKEDMLVAAVKRLGYQGSDHNEADALFLLHMALLQQGRCAVPFPKEQAAAIAGVEWKEAA